MMLDSDGSQIRAAARELAEAFDKTPNCPIKVALATEIFGRDWIGGLRRLAAAREHFRAQDRALEPIEPPTT